MKNNPQGKEKYVRDYCKRGLKPAYTGIYEEENSTKL